VSAQLHFVFAGHSCLQCDRFHNIADCTAALYYGCTEETAIIQCLVSSFVSADELVLVDATVLVFSVSSDTKSLMCLLKVSTGQAACRPYQAGPRTKII